MEHENNNSNDVLAHHGVVGMKWGIRRYQNRNGGLTPAGRKHRAALESKASSKDGAAKTSKGGAKKRGVNNTKPAAKPKNAKPSTPEAPKKKTVAEMTDDELRAHTNRMQLESNYYNAQRNLAIANPKQVFKGQKFVNSLVNDVIAPAAKNAGRAYLENFMKDKLGLNKQDPIARLEKKAKKLELEKKIRDLENPQSDTFDLSKALESYRSMSKEDRDEVKEAAQLAENLDKLRKKNKTN